jgi:hypothetical protein
VYNAQDWTWKEVTAEDITRRQRKEWKENLISRLKALPRTKGEHVCDYDAFVHEGEATDPPAYCAITLGYEEPSFMCKACHDEQAGHPTVEEEPDPLLRAQYFCVVIEGREEKDWREEFDRLNKAAYAPLGGLAKGK